MIGRQHAAIEIVDADRGHETVLLSNVKAENRDVDAGEARDLGSLNIKRGDYDGVNVAFDRQCLEEFSSCVATDDLADRDVVSIA